MATRPMKQRTRTQLNTQELLEESLYSPFLLPWKTHRLEPTSLESYRQRPMLPDISIAELYHANSKLFPQIMSRLGMSHIQDVNGFRMECVRRRASVAQTAGEPCFDVDMPWRKLLTSMVRVITPNLFYAVELRVVSGELLMSYEPLGDTLHVVKHLSANDLIGLTTALELVAELPEHSCEGAFFFILGCFARNDILLGARCYRRTLLEGGQVAQAVTHQASLLGIEVRPLYEFADREVDSVLEVDGIEEGTLMAYEVGRITHV